MHVYIVKDLSGAIRNVIHKILNCECHASFASVILSKS